MEQICREFNVPYYLVEEIVDYIELTTQWHCKYMKCENIKSLLGLAQVNNRLTNEPVDFIIKKYCRK